MIESDIVMRHLCLTTVGVLSLSLPATMFSGTGLLPTSVTAGQNLEAPATVRQATARTKQNTPGCLDRDLSNENGYLPAIG